MIDDPFPLTAAWIAPFSFMKTSQKERNFLVSINLIFPMFYNRYVWYLQPQDLGEVL